MGHLKRKTWDFHSLTQCRSNHCGPSIQLEQTEMHEWDMTKSKRLLQKQPAFPPLGGQVTTSCSQLGLALHCPHSGASSGQKAITIKQLRKYKLESRLRISDEEAESQSSISCQETQQEGTTRTIRKNPSKYVSRRNPEVEPYFAQKQSKVAICNRLQRANRHRGDLQLQLRKETTNLPQRKAVFSSASSLF